MIFPSAMLDPEVRYNFAVDRFDMLHLDPFMQRAAVLKLLKETFSLKQRICMCRFIDFFFPLNFSLTIY